MHRSVAHPVTTISLVRPTVKSFWKPSNAFNAKVFQYRIIICNTNNLRCGNPSLSNYDVSHVGLFFPTNALRFCIRLLMIQHHLSHASSFTVKIEVPSSHKIVRRTNRSVAFPFISFSPKTLHRWSLIQSIVSQVTSLDNSSEFMNKLMPWVELCEPTATLVFGSPSSSG